MNPPAWLAVILADTAALRAHWSSARGGWMAARRDAIELVKYRRLRVDTSAMTQDGMEVVLRTRLRLIGDAQTDVLRRWLTTATPRSIERTSAAHFQSVRTALGGWNVARAMERLAVRFAWLVGGGYSVVVLLATPRADVLHLLWTSWRLWAGFALPAIAALVRRVLRWRLRTLFRRGLTVAVRR